MISDLTRLYSPLRASLPLPPRHFVSAAACLPVSRRVLSNQEAPCPSIEPSTEKRNGVGGAVELAAFDEPRWFHN